MEARRGNSPNLKNSVRNKEKKNKMEKYFENIKSNIECIGHVTWSCEGGGDTVVGWMYKTHDMELWRGENHCDWLNAGANKGNERCKERLKWEGCLSWHRGGGKSCWGCSESINSSIYLHLRSWFRCCWLNCAPLTTKVTCQSPDLSVSGQKCLQRSPLTQ